MRMEWTVSSMAKESACKLPETVANSLCLHSFASSLPDTIHKSRHGKDIASRLSPSD